MQKYDFTAPASGAPLAVNAPGRYLKYVTGNAGGNDTGLIITPGGKPGSKILLYPGQAFTLPDDGTPGPNAWTLANAVGAGQIVGTVVIGDGRIDDNTLSGVVQVVDGGKSRTLAGSAFAAAPGISAVAAQNGRVQLWNPLGSNVRAIVNAVVMRANATAQTYAIGFLTAALATVQGQGISKVGGGTAAKCQYTNDTTATAWTIGIMPALMAGSVQANSLQAIGITEPIVLPPGYGLTLYSNTPNADALGIFEWYEEPNV